MMHHLVMPAQLAGQGVESDDAVGVQIRPLPVAAVEAVGRIAARQHHHAPLDIDRPRAPLARTGPVDTAVRRPGLAARLARLGYKLEPPEKLPGPRIVAAWIPAGPERGTLLRGRTH